ERTQLPPERGNARHPGNHRHVRGDPVVRAFGIATPGAASLGHARCRYFASRVGYRPQQRGPAGTA
ncbi:hypothetical protein, partial [Xylella fastidiosa]|uniref:hypothetical protein n=1 Tax=Xylella fastidiosa TaxID=2371 RepID=UPI001EEA2269